MMRCDNRSVLNKMNVSFSQDALQAQIVIRKMSEIMDTANKEEEITSRDATVATDPTPDQEKAVEVKVYKQYPRTKLII